MLRKNFGSSLETKKETFIGKDQFDYNVIGGLKSKKGRVTSSEG